jgi:hypothetical protein
MKCNGMLNTSQPQIIQGICRFRRQQSPWRIMKWKIMRTNSTMSVHTWRVKFVTRLWPRIKPSLALWWEPAVQQTALDPFLHPSKIHLRNVTFDELVNPSLEQVVGLVDGEADINSWKRFLIR